MKKKIFAAALSIAAAISPLSAQAAPVSESDVTAIPLGRSRGEIHAAIGSPDEASVNGTKEVFRLNGGGTAVLIYNIWSYSDYGYIIH